MPHHHHLRMHSPTQSTDSRFVQRPLRAQRQNERLMVVGAGAARVWNARLAFGKVRPRVIGRCAKQLEC